MFFVVVFLHTYVHPCLLYPFISPLFRTWIPDDLSRRFILHCVNPVMLRFWLSECTGDTVRRQCWPSVGAGSFCLPVQFNLRHRRRPTEAGSYPLKGKVAHQPWISAPSLLRLNHVIQTEEETKMDLLPVSNGLFFFLFTFFCCTSAFSPSHSILIGLKLLRLPLLWSSFILIATAHCRLCPYVIAAQQMDWNALRNLPRHY